MKIAGLLLILSLISLSSQAIITIPTSCASPCSLSTLSLGGLLNALIEFDSSSFNSQANFVVVVDINIVNGLTVASGTSNATLLLSSAVTIANALSTTALQVGSGATVSVTNSVTVTGNAIIDGTLNLADNANANLQVNGNLQTSQTSSSSNANIYVGANASLRVKAGTLIANAIQVAQQGAIAVDQTATASANVVVAGTISASAYTQAAATLLLQNAVGVVSATSVTISAGAVLAGNGNITGSLTVEANATVSVGNSPGTVYVNGDYTMKSTSTFTLEIAGDNSYDKIIISGTAYLNGYLQAKSIDNYSPSGDKTYNFMAHSKRSGTFNAVYGNSFGTLSKYSVNYDQALITSVTYSSAATVAVSVTMMIIALMFTML